MYFQVYVCICIYICIHLNLKSQRNFSNTEYKSLPLFFEFVIIIIICEPEINCYGIYKYPIYSYRIANIFVSHLSCNANCILNVNLCKNREQKSESDRAINEKQTLHFFLLSVNNLVHQMNAWGSQCSSLMVRPIS